MNSIHAKIGFFFSKGCMPNCPVYIHLTSSRVHLAETWKSGITNQGNEGWSGFLKILPA